MDLPLGSPLNSPAMRALLGKGARLVVDLAELLMQKASLRLITHTYRECQ